MNRYIFCCVLWCQLVSRVTSPDLYRSFYHIFCSFEVSIAGKNREGVRLSIFMGVAVRSVVIIPSDSRKNHFPKNIMMFDTTYHTTDTDSHKNPSVSLNNPYHPYVHHSRQMENRPTQAPMIRNFRLTINLSHILRQARFHPTLHLQIPQPNGNEYSFFLFTSSLIILLVDACGVLSDFSQTKIRTSKATLHSVATATLNLNPSL